MSSHRFSQLTSVQYFFILTFIPQHKSVLINNVTGKTNIYIYNIAGTLLKQSEINTSTFIDLTNGLYVIKAFNSNGSIAKKIMID